MLGVLRVVGALGAALVAFGRHGTPFWQPRLPGQLLFAPHALEGLRARLDVDEAARLGVPLHPVTRRRLRLGPTPGGSIAVAVPGRLVRRHVGASFSMTHATLLGVPGPLESGRIATVTGRISGIGERVNLTSPSGNLMIQGYADAVPPRR
jgi:hypothetical protein